MVFCEALIIISQVLSLAQINQESVNYWNKLCALNDKNKIVLCKNDRVYLFAPKNQKMTFDDGKKWCKRLAPCEELGDLVSISDCDELNSIVKLTNRFITEENISDDNVPIWTSKLNDLEKEQNLINNCNEEATFDHKKVIDSNYSVLEIESPRLFVRNTEEEEETDLNSSNIDNEQLGYVLCEIIKPTTNSICEKIKIEKLNSSKCLILENRKKYKSVSKDEKIISTTPLFEFEDDYFNWIHINEMINKKKNFSKILKKIETNLDKLFDYGSIVNLTETIDKLNKLRDEEILKNNSLLVNKKNQKEITLTYMNIYSKSLDKKNRDAWTKIDYSTRKNVSMEIILSLNNLIENAFCSLNDNETFILNNENNFKNRLAFEYILLEAFNLDNIILNETFQFPSILDSNLTKYFGEYRTYFPDGLNLTKVNLPKTNFCKKNQKNNFATGIVYKNLAEYLHYNQLLENKLKNKLNQHNPLDKINDFDDEEILNESNLNFEDEKIYSNFIVNSNLIAFTINNIIKTTVQLNQPVRISMQHLETKKRFDKVKCVFWDFNEKKWSDNGCRLIEISRSNSICECDHLTNFAILMDTSGREYENSYFKTILSTICILLSIFGLIVTILVFTFITKLKNKRNTITVNLCINLLFVNFIVGFFMETQNIVLCRLISIALFYFLINSFIWMLIQGYFLYQMIVLVFSNIGYFRLKHMLIYSNGFSFSWSIFVFLIIGPEGFYNENYSYFCWLSNPNQQKTIWFFMAPVLITCFLNLLIILLSFKETYYANKRRSHLSNIPQPILKATSNLCSKSLKSMKNSLNSIDKETKKSKIKSWFKGWISLVLLLGLTWIVGFLMFIDIYQIASYLFILLNSLQGFFIFLFEIVFNLKSRKVLIKLIQDKVLIRHLNITPSDSQSSNQTKTSNIIQTSSSGLSQFNDSGESIQFYVNSYLQKENDSEKNKKY